MALLARRFTPRSASPDWRIVFSILWNDMICSVVGILDVIIIQFKVGYKLGIK